MDELSVEEEYARDLGLRIGSKVVFDVQGVPVSLTVTSLRKVHWESFGINFFWVVEPGVLDRAPQMRIASVRLPAGGEQRLQDALAATTPNVTVFAIREVLEKVGAVLERIALGVRFLGGFTLLAGLAILAGVVVSSVPSGATSAAPTARRILRSVSASAVRPHDRMTGRRPKVSGDGGNHVRSRRRELGPHARSP